MTIIEFFHHHWFLAWCALWLVWLLGPVLMLPNMILRTIRVCWRGWPPAHLDVDGDWKDTEAD